MVEAQFKAKFLIRINECIHGQKNQYHLHGANIACHYL